MQFSVAMLKQLGIDLDDLSYVASWIEIGKSYWSL